MEFTKTDLNRTLRVKESELKKLQKWYRVDATGKTLGRLAVDISKKLLGKDKAYYNDFWNAGDFILVENIENVTVTGKKLDDKMYYTYSGYKGNVKSVTLGVLLQKDPARALMLAVKGMLAKNKLRDQRLKRLKIVKGTTTKYDNFKPLNLYK